MEVPPIEENQGIADKDEERIEILSELENDTEMSIEEKGRLASTMRNRWRREDFSEGFRKKMRSRFFRETQQPEQFVRDAVTALADLALEMRAELPSYETILSDDVGGRLVTLYFKRIIDTLRAREKKGSVKPYFIALGRQEDEGGVPRDTFDTPNAQSIDAFIASGKATFGKTLVLTEHVGGGGTIARLLDILVRNGVEFDLATVSKTGAEHLPNAEQRTQNVKNAYRISQAFPDKKKLSDLKVFSIASPSLNVGVFFDDAEAFSGVIRDAASSSAHPARNPGSEHADLREVREDMNLLADDTLHLIDAYEDISKH